MTRAYYQRFTGVTWNPCNSYVREHWQELYPVDHSTQYSRYLDRVYEAFQEAAKAAYEHKGYTTAERKYGVKREHYEKLQAIADRYYDRATNAIGQ